MPASYARLINTEKMLVRYLIFTSLFLAFLSLHARVHGQPLFEVERESFCGGMGGNEPQKSFTGTAEIKRGEGIFFWMEIRGGERALTMLEAKGEMPIYHAWASEKGVTDVINIGITKERWFELREKIMGEAKRKGSFTWRTYSVKRNLTEGHWYVSVLDANRKYVKKSGSGTEAFRPEIVIRFIK